MPPEPSPASSPSPASGRRGLSRHLVDLAPLRASPAFARLWIGGAISGIGAFMTQVAVGLQVYEITESTFMVGLVGGIALLPMIIAGLWGGVIADVFDRRRVLIVASLTAWASTVALAALSFHDQHLHADGTHAAVWHFFVVTTLSAVASTVSNATRGSVVGRILPADMISRATALNGISFGVMLTVGPALAGVLAAGVGLPWTFTVDAVLFSAGFLGIWMLPSLPRLGERVEAGWPVLKEGLAFLRRSPNIRMSFVVDIIAMTFGRPYVLFPALGATLVGGGALTVGALAAAGAVGTMLTSLFSGPVARVHRHGVAISRAIQVFGVFAALFGLTTLVATAVEHEPAEGWGGVHWPTLAVLALCMAGMGAADEVSAIFRQTMIIQAAPDEMRGRLQGVFVVVVTGGPRLGDMYAGALAAAVALWFPPLLGGVLVIALIAILTRAQRAWREYDAQAPTP
ncbi:MFS transporter [Demequina sp. SYSU T00039]|uniref:MFS transporter n=1 Tax=Demequina lignilytica TaxID=3051663 RepID=A0AAW7M4I4_9MICO|nr:MULTISPECIES: MFS transporter [unclassified Demequina]MDN4479259.1 MFS transporter [Demequina sp. SYSU T00039-1]MDN4487577.1 MFS transporter [Demequina sp. SYSU T00039]